MTAINCLTTVIGNITTSTDKLMTAMNCLTIVIGNITTSLDLLATAMHDLAHHQPRPRTQTSTHNGISMQTNPYRAPQRIPHHARRPHTTVIYDTTTATPAPTSPHANNCATTTTTQQSTSSGVTTHTSTRRDDGHLNVDHDTHRPRIAIPKPEPRKILLKTTTITRTA